MNSNFGTVAIRFWRQEAGGLRLDKVAAGIGIGPPWQKNFVLAFGPSILVPPVCLLFGACCDGLW